MPELPEVERFRQLLLPFVSTEFPLSLSLTSDRPDSVKFSRNDISSLFGDGNRSEGKRQHFLKSVNRKGKLIYLHLIQDNSCVDNIVSASCASTDDRDNDDSQNTYLFLHMGMTGRISTPESSITLETSKREKNETKESFPPPHTHILFQSGNHVASFSDPRKFGRVNVRNSLREVNELAPDALNDEDQFDGCCTKLEGQQRGIKAILLDQKYSLSGIGNWCVDEILYRSCIHPDQKFLSREECTTIMKEIKFVMNTAVGCLSNEKSFPSDWIFHLRWNKAHARTSDVNGRRLAFVKSQGRTSLIAPCIQKKTDRSSSTNERYEEKKSVKRRKQKK